MTNIKFLTSDYSGYETSPEVLEAIEKISNATLAPGCDDEQGPAYDIWNNPSLAQADAVIDHAFNLADPGDDTLFWGQNTIRRPK
jgi:hypothetical protein